MSYVTTRRILVLATGFSRGAGEPIYPSELEPDVWNPMIAEGVIVEEGQAPEPERPTLDATDGALKLVGELGMDLCQVTGTSQDGRILVADVRRAQAEAELDQQES